jgi:hypothetical protein
MIRPEFVRFVPDVLESGVLYISVQYATAVHACACGCAEKVVTPIRPTDWSLIWDGETISLRPSIGNWSLPCRSHYWIRENRIIWATGWSQQEIEAGREQDRLAREAYNSRPKAHRTKRRASPSSD